MPQGHRIYLDVNIWIYALEKRPEYTPILTELFQQIDQGILSAITSELSLAEALVKPIQSQDIQKEQEYRQLFSSRGTIYIIPIHRSILVESANQRAIKPSLRLPDAIHISTALFSQCSTFLTNDQRLKNVSTIPTVILSDITL